jgi:hypothetical protein
MPAPTALLRRPDDFTIAQDVPLPEDGMHCTADIIFQIGD